MPPDETAPPVVSRRGLYIAGGSTTLTGKTAVVLNFATTANNNIYGTYST